MTFDNLCLTFFSWGKKLNPEEYENFRTYFQKCLMINRVILIKNESGDIDAVMTFFLTCDENKMYKPSLWSLIEEDAEGDKIIIDLMLCRNWKLLSIRNILQEFLENNFNVLEGHYYHAPYGPHVKIKRRRPLNVQRSDLVRCGV